MKLSYARTMLRIVSLCIDSVPVTFVREAVPPRQPFLERRKPIEAFVAACRPSGLPEDDERGRPRGQMLDQLAAQPLDHRRIDVMVEVKIVDEPGGLDQPAA